MGIVLVCDLMCTDLLIIINSATCRYGEDYTVVLLHAVTRVFQPIILISACGRSQLSLKMLILRKVRLLKEVLK